MPCPGTSPFESLVSQYDLTPQSTQVIEARLAALNLRDRPFPFEASAQELVQAKTPLLSGTDVELKRAEIRAYFHATSTMFERMHEVLKDDSAFYIQPERLRHPLVFYFGHTSVFFVNKLMIGGIVRSRIDPSIESMCAIGVDEMSWDDLNPSHYNWPTIDRLREYRNQVRDLVDELITTLPLQLPITWESPFWVILMGIEHERIHLETSSVLFRQLPVQYVKETPLMRRFQNLTTPDTIRANNESNLNAANQALINTGKHLVDSHNVTESTSHLLPELKSEKPGDVQHAASLLEIANELESRTFTTKHVPGRQVVLGKATSHHMYGWDNEFGQDVETIKSFEAGTRIISNRQFLAFVLDGGYSDKSLWSEEGWKFASYKTQTLHQPWPAFWVPSAAGLEGLQLPPLTKAILEDGAADASSLPDSFNSTLRVPRVPYPESLSITGYKYRWISGVIDMPWDWPVDLNNLESQAFCAWVQSRLPTTPETSNLICRLPTEAEFKGMQLHIMSTYGSTSSTPLLSSQSEQTVAQLSPVNDFDFPLDASNAITQNLSLTHASSSPVDHYQYLNSGFYDVIGNVWQHCSSFIYPFPNFKVHPVYDDFTVPTYDNMHNIIAGGSWISTGNAACYHARYAFRRHFYQHAGCRLGLFTTQPKICGAQAVEQDASIANQLHSDFFDLLTEEDLCRVESPFMKRFLSTSEPNGKLTASLVHSVVEKLTELEKLPANYQPRNIMVLGCQGGRSSIELAAAFPAATVQGIDTTVRLLGAGLHLMEGNQVSYLLRSSYDQPSFVRLRHNTLRDALTARNLNLESISKRVNLMQTDVCNLPSDKVPLDAYNLILVDCLDVCYDPKMLLQNISRHCMANNEPTLVALCVYHAWNQPGSSEATKNVWGYRDLTNGEFVDVECGLAHIVPAWKLLKKADYQQRLRRVNERVYSFIDMTCYFYLVQRQ